MAIDPETRQRLLELIYDLLPDTETEALRRQISENEELARAYEAACEQAGLFREASLQKAPPIRLYPPTKPIAVPFVPVPRSEPSRPKAAPRSVESVRASWARWANWIVGVSAGILLAVSIGAYLYHRGQLADIAAEHLHLRVTGPSKLPAGVPSRYSVKASSIAGGAVEAQVEVTLATLDGKTLLTHKEKTDDQGLLTVTIPEDLALPSTVRLAVAGTYRGQQERVEGELGTAGPQFTTRMLVDRPICRPGETLQWRSLTLSRLGLTADRELPIRYEVLDPRGQVLPTSTIDAVTRRGAASGQFTLPPAIEEGQYAVVAKSPDGSFADQRAALLVQGDSPSQLSKELQFVRGNFAPGENAVAQFSCFRPNGDPSAGAELTAMAVVDGTSIFQTVAAIPPHGSTRIEFALPDRIERADAKLAVVVEDSSVREVVSKPIPLRLGKARVQFFPEGGSLVAGLENRVYFASRRPDGKPVELAGRVINSQGKVVAAVETKHAGMGRFSLVPVPGEQYRLKIDRPAEAEDARLPDALAPPGVVLNAGPGVFDAAKPMEFVVSSSVANRPLVVAASCRGATVGQAAIVTDEDANAATIALDDAVAGVIRLTAYDYRASPPKPVAERLVYRRPSQRLQIDWLGDAREFVAGKRAELGVSVKDENGSPKAAALAARLVDASLVNGPGARTGLASEFLFGDELDDGGDLGDLSRYLADDAQAAETLDMILATRDARRTQGKGSRGIRPGQATHEQLAQLATVSGQSDPPAMFDNLPDLRTRHASNLASYRANRTRVLNALTAMSFFGGAALLILLALLTLMNIPCGLRLWAPSTGVAIVCLVIGAILLDPERLHSTPQRAVAFATFQSADSEKPKDAKGLPDSLDRADGQSHQMKAREELVKQEVAAQPAPESPKALEEPGKPAAQLRQLDREREALQEKSAIEELRRGQVAKREPLEAGRQNGQKTGELFVRRDQDDKALKSKPAPDSRDKLLGSPLLRTDAQGRATVAFDLPESGGKYWAFVDAYAEGGRLGAATMEIGAKKSQAGDYIPPEYTAGDQLDLATPLAALAKAKTEERGRLAIAPSQQPVDSDRFRWEMNTGDLAKGAAPLALFKAKALGGRAFHPWGEIEYGGNSQPIRIVPAGYPDEKAQSGWLERREEIPCEMPANAGSATAVTLTVFPGALSCVDLAAISLLETPGGCLDREAALSLLGALALECLQNRDVVSAPIARRAWLSVDTGFEKFPSYEAAGGGLSWFGDSLADEIASTFGVLSLQQAAKVREIDKALLARTNQWFQGRMKDKSALKAVDPAILALSLLADDESGAKSGAQTLSAQLAKVQADDGHVDPEKDPAGSIEGLTRKAEITALAALLWLRQSEHAARADRAVTWLVRHRQASGGFGSPLATALALKAVVERARRDPRPAAPEKLTVKCAGQTIAETQIVAGRQEAVVLTGLEKKLPPGKSKLVLESAGTHRMSYLLSIQSWSPIAPKDEGCPLRLTARLESTKLRRGESTVLIAEVTNVSDREASMPVALLGLPAGLEARADQLESLKESGLVAGCGVCSREIAMRLRSLGAKQNVQWKIPVTASAPGKFTGPPSRVYLNTAPERRQWASPIAVEISR